MKIFRTAFTLLEIIFVIVIIGILSALAIPKFSYLKDNAKIAAELSTASSVQTSIKNCHGEWIVNDANFTCANSISRDELNSTTGYPIELGSSVNHPLDKILKNAQNIQWRRDEDNSSIYYGPTYGNINDIDHKDDNSTPDGNDYWIYSEENGSFYLKKVD